MFGVCVVQMWFLCRTVVVVMVSALVVFWFCDCSLSIVVFM